MSKNKQKKKNRKWAACMRDMIHMKQFLMHDWVSVAKSWAETVLELYGVVRGLHQQQVEKQQVQEDKVRQKEQFGLRRGSVQTH